MYRKTLRAAEAIAVLLANYAKSHHGKTARPARIIYRGYKIKGRGKLKGRQVASKYLRPAGTGWGDITGNLNSSIRAGVVEATMRAITIGLTADMSYAVFVETMRDGRWAWLFPAIEDNRQLILQILANEVRV
jgi:hypothetical protein